MFCYRFIFFAALISACFGDPLLSGHQTRIRELAPAATDSFGISFNGFRKASSIKKGTIDVSWNAAVVDEECFSLEDVSYDIFVATGEYDFSKAENIPDLIDLFEANADYQHIEVPGDVRKLSIDSTNYGQLHTLLITANVAGEYSRNRKGSKVTLSRFNPRIRDGIEIIGVFVPCQNIDIDLESCTVGQEHNLTFSGSGVTQEAKQLKKGDYISGFTSELDSFVRLVTDKVVKENDLVVLRVVDVPLEDIFDRLDVDGVFGISVEDGLGIQDASRRQLIFGFVADAFEFVADKIMGPAVAIGGPILDVQTAITDYIGLDLTWELGERITLVDISEEYSRGNEFVTLQGGVYMTQDLVVQIHMNGARPDYVRVGIEVGYWANSFLTLTAEAGINDSLDIDLWQGPKKSKWFMMGKVPVEVYWQPKLDLRLEVGASISATAQIGVEVGGSTGVSAIYNRDDSRELYGEVMPPSLDPTYCLEIGAEASFETSATYVLGMDVGVYRGFLNTNAGVGIGLVFERGIAADVGGFLSSTFDMMVRYSVPFQAEALYGTLDVFETNLYEYDVPIISLESPILEIPLLEDYTCSCSGMCRLTGNLFQRALSSGNCDGVEIDGRCLSKRSKKSEKSKKSPRSSKSGKALKSKKSSKSLKSLKSPKSSKSKNSKTGRCGKQGKKKSSKKSKSNKKSN